MKINDKTSILLADNDEVSLLFYREVLKTINAKNVQTASSGQTAKDLLIKQHFDLALVHERLGSVSGQEICQLIKKAIIKPKLLLLAVTLKPKMTDSMNIFCPLF